jgi:hypothetical protein
MGALKALGLALLTILAPMSATADVPNKPAEVYSIAKLDRVGVFCAFDPKTQDDATGVSVRCVAIKISDGDQLATAEGFIPEGRFGSVERHVLDRTFAIAALSMIAPLAEAEGPAI